MTVEVNTLLLASLAIVISVSSLAWTWWSDSTTRKCQFKYDAYDRLIEVGREVNQKMYRTRDRIDEARRAEGNDVQQQFDRYLVEVINGITAFEWKIKIDPLAFDDKILDDIKDSVRTLQDMFDKLSSERRQGTASNSDVVEFMQSAGDFWNKTIQMVDSALENAASTIRVRCS